MEIDNQLLDFTADPTLVERWVRSSSIRRGR
jgi:hypothetical protein